MDYDKLYMGGETQKISKEDKKKLKIEKLNEELGVLENEITKIFDELSSSKEFSLYKISYLLKKVHLLQIKISEIIREDTFEDVKRKHKLITVKLMLLLIIGLPLMNILPYVSLIIASIMIGFDLKFIRDSKALNKRYTENSKEFFTRLSSFKITSLNCINLIQEKTNILSKKSKLAETAQQEDKFVIANNIIVDLVNKRKSDYIDENISQEVCDIIRKILQDDLNTEETNLSILIDIAREKIDIENMTNELGIKRKVLADEL